MKVYGYEITDEHDFQLAQEILRRTRTEEGMTNLEAVCFLERIGVPANEPGRGGSDYVSVRAADRLLQKYRKRGQIELRKGRWFHVEREAQETQ